MAGVTERAAAQPRIRHAPSADERYAVVIRVDAGTTRGPNHGFGGDVPAPFPPRLFDRVLQRTAVKIGVRLERARDQIAQAALPTLATEAQGFVMRLPRELRNPDRIHVGRDVKLGPSSVLAVQTAYPGGWLRHPEGRHVAQSFEPELHLGDRVTATAALQVTVFDRVVIEDDVMFAANVFVADGTHASGRGDTAYKYQGIAGVAPVRIGRGAWIGQNAVVLPGVTIGAYAIVGANSVVAGDVPEGCVAVGAPARVIKCWDPEAERWTRTAAAVRAGERAPTEPGA
ncbi:MAG: acyltransferase [Trueperaceae bacterium]|nr:acyltransferase [Trueperaceae bacterium]